MTEDPTSPAGLGPDRRLVAQDEHREQGREPATVPCPSWAERLLEAEGNLLRMLSGGGSAADVLGEICAMVAELRPGSGCAILLPDPSGGPLRIASAAGLPEAAGDAAESVPTGPAWGPIGEAPDGEPGASALFIEGFRSFQSIPIRASGACRKGTVILFRRDEGPPSPPDLILGDRAAELAAIAVDRQGARSATEQDRRRLQLAIEAGRLGTWDWDIRSGSVRWSDNVEEIHGLPPGTFDGTFEGFRTLIHPDDLGRVDEAIASALASRSKYEVEFRVVRPDGSVGWMLGKGLVFEDRDGRPVRMIGFGVDLTAIKQAEQESRDSRELFRTLADSIPQLVWMASPEGELDWFNRRCYEFSGSTFEQLEGRGWQSLHDPRELPRVMAGFEEALRDGEPWEDTFPLRRHDGQMRWHLSRALPVRDDEGRIVRWFGTNTDITDRMEMEAALREADRRKDEFLAMLAHELRNPIAPIATALHLIGREGVCETISAEARTVADRQVRHLCRLIDDLMDVARINRGRIALRLSLIDLADVARRAVVVCLPAIEDRSQSLAVELPEAPIPLSGDPTRLEQIVWNLLENASKYSEAGGRIVMSVRREGPIAVVEVSDDGVGIDPEQLGRIFDPFMRPEVRYDRSRGGLGIGLSLVKTLAGLHGGSVEARSEGRGHGSTFLVRLPVLAEEAEAPDDRPSGLPPEDDPDTIPRRHRILIVDDNEDAAAVLARLLQRVYGQEVEVVHDGPKALDASAAFRPEVVLLDIGLPGLDGFEVARRLRARDETRDALIIALTGWGQQKDRDQSREAGFDHHLVKPASVDRIARLIREAGRAAP